MIAESEAKEDFGIYLNCAPYQILDNDDKSFTSFIQEMASEEEMPSPTSSKKKSKGKNMKKKQEREGEV